MDTGNHQKGIMRLGNRKSVVRSERSVIEIRAQIGGKEHKWLFNDRKMGTAMWYCVSRTIQGFWNKSTFC